MIFFNSLDKSGDLGQLQNRITEIFALLAGILMLFLGVSDYFLGLNPLIIKVKFLLSIPFLSGFFWMRKKGSHQIALHLLFGTGLLAITLNYFYNDGFRGPTLYTIFIFIVAMVILMKSWTKLIWLLATLAIYGGLFWGEISGKYVIESHYADSNNLFWDHLITILWTSIFSFLGIYIFIKNYKIQNKLMAQFQLEKDLVLNKLEELNLKKNQLIALLSHDLKNPINVLSTTLEVVEQGGFEKGELELILRDLKDQSFHLSKILDNTLSWVIAELEDREMVLEDVNVFELTQEIVDTMQIQAARKNQHILFEKVGEDRTLKLEIHEIMIILKNLLDNAIKFSSPDANISLKVEVSDDMLRWEVKNEASVIEEGMVKELFEFKVKSSLGTNREKGTGIGLPLCKNIAEKLQMELGFESQKDNENVFYLIRKN